MKKLIVLLLITVIFSSCFTVSQVGNCKYYYRGPIGSKNKPHQLVGF